MAVSWLDQRDATAPFLLFVHGYDDHAPTLKPTPFGYAYADPKATGAGQDAVRSNPENAVDGLFPMNAAWRAKYEESLAAGPEDQS